jgi:hypothetical protein
MTWGPTEQPLDRRPGQTDPAHGPPTSRSLDPVVAAHGPHHLSDDTWRGAIGPPWRFGSILGRMAGGSPYIYEGRGLK